ncbi:MAG: type III pantothenate kinase [Vicingus serpentipes]|nr:type III pantothenate kinase [Vicingus serpentipes]
MNLIIDQGNTHVKLAVFEQDKLLAHQVLTEMNETLISAFIANYAIKKGILSSVKKEKPTQLLKKYNLLQFSSVTPLPLTLNYKTPTTLGLDRIAAVVGAQQQYPNTNVLVVDMGTCITYDFLDQEGVYWGGAISPGLQIRFKAMEHYTDQLPLVSFKKEGVKLVGDTTESAIMAGGYYGIEAEVNGMIQKYIQQYKDLQIIITGGDGNLFDIAPKNRIFADEFIVLKGLNKILNDNDKIK